MVSVDVAEQLTRDRLNKEKAGEGRNGHHLDAAHSSAVPRPSTAQEVKELSWILETLFCCAWVGVTSLRGGTPGATEVDGGIVERAACAPAAAACSCAPPHKIAPLSRSPCSIGRAAARALHIFTSISGSHRLGSRRR